MSAPHSPSRISRNPLKAPLLRRICSIPAMAITSRVSHVYVARALTAPPLPGGARCIPMPRGIVRHVDTLPLGGDAPPDPPGRRPGAAAYPVSAARQDQGPGIAERAGHVGHRRRPRRGQPPRHPSRLPGARHGPDRGRPLDADQAGGCPASAAARDDTAARDHAAARDDAAHRLRPHAGAGSSLGAPGASAIARLMLRDALPLHVGDRVLLRDPGSAGLAIQGATVLDVMPPALTRRGAAAVAGAELATWADLPSAADLLLRVTEQIVLAPGAQAEAARLLARLPQPFTTAEARQALGTTRRVAIPLLEYLDRAGITQRLPDDRRRLRLGAGTSPVWCGSARGSESQRLRNSGERRRASATRRAVPKVLTTRRNTRPPPWTPKTEAPGWSAIEMVAYMSWLFRTVTRRSPLLSTW